MSPVIVLSHKICVAVLLGAGALTGCSVAPTGAPPPAASASFTVCSGVHASRLPGREAVGRVCERSAALSYVARAGTRPRGAIGRRLIGER